jgi:hypothetical protein
VARRATFSTTLRPPCWSGKSSAYPFVYAGKRRQVIDGPRFVDHSASAQVRRIGTVSSMSAWKTAAGPAESCPGPRHLRDRRSRLAALTGLSWPGSLASMRSWRLASTGAPPENMRGCSISELPGVVWKMTQGALKLGLLAHNEHSTTTRDRSSGPPLTSPQTDAPLILMRNPEQKRVKSPSV